MNICLCCVWPWEEKTSHTPVPPADILPWACPAGSSSSWRFGQLMCLDPLILKCHVYPSEHLCFLDFFHLLTFHYDLCITWMPSSHVQKEMPPPWKCSSPGRMGLWATSSSGRCLCLEGLEDSFQPKLFYDSMILWFYGATLAVFLVPSNTARSLPPALHCPKAH